MNKVNHTGGRRSAKRRTVKRRKSIHRRRSVKRGGSGAAEYAISVYGTQQHAGTSGNVIAMNMPPQAGGGKTGGNALATVAVPALLIAANQLYKPKNKSFNKYKGGSASMDSLTSTLNAASSTMQTLNTNMGGANTTPPAIISGAGGAPDDAYFKSENVPIASGGGRRRKGGVGRRKGGVGVFDDIAVPAVLIAANQMYKRKTRAFSRSNRRR